MAPEIILQEEGYNTKADIWALGITILEITSGQVPHYDEDATITLRKIIEGSPSELSRYYDWSPEFRALVEDCLVKDPKQRISTCRILKKHHKFFNKRKGQEYIKEKLLDGLPPLKDRISEDVLEIGKAYFDEKYRKQAALYGFEANTNVSKKKQKVAWNFSDDWDANSKTKPSSKDNS